MSYRQQIQALFQLNVDPGFRAAFHEDPVAATPLLSAVERDELLKLPIARPRASTAPAHGSQGAEYDSAFMRIGLRKRCSIALPRTYELVKRLAERRGQTLEGDFLRNLELWRPTPPEYDRDAVEPNPAIHWTETARVLQMANRIFWQFYGYAEGVARRQASEVPYLAELARFEFETLARRVVLYKRFVRPGPVPVPTSADSRLVLGSYAEFAVFEYRVGQPEPAPDRMGIVFLYNGDRLRVLQVGAEACAALERLDGERSLGEFEERQQRVLTGLAGLGALAVAS